MDTKRSEDHYSAESFSSITPCRESLLESKERFRLFYERSPLGYQSLDERGRLLDVNAAWLDALLYSRDEVIGRWFGDFVAPDDAKCFEERFARFKLAGTISGAQFEMIRKDGSRIVVEFDGKIGYDAEGNFQQTYCIMRDVTERKLAEERYCQLFTSMESAFAVHEIIRDEDGTPCNYRFLEINPAFERQTGLRAENLIGRTVLEVMPHTETSWIDRYGHVVDTGQSVRFEDYSRDLDRWYDVLAYRSQPEQFAVLFTDLTKQKQINQQIQAEKDRAQMYLDIVGSMLIALDLDGKVLLINRRGCEILGCKQEEIIGQDWFTNFLPAESRDQVREIFAQIMRGQIEQVEYAENLVLCVDGSTRTIAWHNAVVHDSNGAISGILSSGEDITDRKQAEEKLRAVERLRAETNKMAATGRMAARVAHEINNPLAGIKNSFLLIKDAVPGNHPDHDMVAIIERELDRIALIVKQMYELHSPQANNIGNVSVDQAIRDVVAMLKPLCLQHRVEIETVNTSADLVLNLPEGGLHQILYNLLSNAIEASSPGGVVVISVELERASGHILIECHDQGQGIPVEQRDRVFEPFFTTKEYAVSEMGMGLGLSIIKSLTEALGGAVDFESTPNKGTVFRVRLPLNTMK